jgi:hypothetical protein
MIIAALIGAGACTSAVAAPEEAQIQKCIKKGAKYLQVVHKPKLGYSGGSNGLGSACLAGMALLEAGIPADDSSVKNIVKFVRENAFAPTPLYEVYETSLMIMFLDRLGDRADQGLIQYLGIRLMAGQGASGGWSYTCGVTLTAQEEARLKAALRKDSRLVSGAPKTDAELKYDPKKEQPAEPKKEAKAKPKADDRPALHPEVAKLGKLLNQNGPNRDLLGGGLGGDNSNTQFAALGLWCARKHGVPCDRALELVGKRFRSSQNADGGWGYASGADSESGGELGSNSTASMTCAGLVGLAVAAGASEHVLRNKPDAAAPKKAVDLTQDAVIKRGLKCLGEFIGQAKGGREPVRGPRGKGRGRFGMGSLQNNMYSLWSLERVGVIYGLQAIGNHDWYAWGAALLIDAQQADGAWDIGGYPGADEELSTSFAMLFLCRANVAKDLSASLKSKIKDPGSATLRGGAGAPDLASKGPNATATKDEPRDPRPKKIEPKRDPVVPTDPATVQAKEFDAQAAKLCASLVNADAEARPAILAQLRDSKGSINTEALARAAAKLNGDAQQDARVALAKRLTRMTASTLREMLKDEHREIRIGAATACGLREDRQFIPDLISSLGEAEPQVVAAARASLQALSGKDFGPEPGAPAGEKLKSVLAWKTWWAAQPK